MFKFSSLAKGLSVAALVGGMTSARADQIIIIVVPGSPSPLRGIPAWAAGASPLEQAQIWAQAQGRVLTPVERDAAINAHLRQFAAESMARWDH
jgi:hypothetical protein